MVVLERLLSKPRCVHEMQYLESKIIKFPYANSYTRSFIVLMKCRKHVRVNMTNHLRSTMGKTTYLHSLCFSSLLFKWFLLTRKLDHSLLGAAGAIKHKKESCLFQLCAYIIFYGIGGVSWTVIWLLDIFDVKHFERIDKFQLY